MDPDVRLQKVVDEIEKLCRKSMSELLIMYQEMHEILKFNKEHFYGNFKNIIVDEMIDNFRMCTEQSKLTTDKKFQILSDNINLSQVKKILLK
jgi:hypothetical protein